MKDDTISRQAALDALNGGFTVTGRENADVIMNFLNGVCKKLRDLPSAERRGRWVDLKCDQCGQVDMSKPNYCPNCGASMMDDDDKHGGTGGHGGEIKTIYKFDENYCTEENCETFQRDLSCERCTK